MSNDYGYGYVCTRASLAGLARCGSFTTCRHGEIEPHKYRPKGARWFDRRRSQLCPGPAARSEAGPQ